MLSLSSSPIAPSISTNNHPVEIEKLSLDSKLQDLSLYDMSIDVSSLGSELARIFNENTLVPGVILKDKEAFVGMISRKQFLERMSKPYGLELFTKRPLYSLQKFVTEEILVLNGETLIVSAAKKSLQRPHETLYEPIVVDLKSECYLLLDVHDLLIAQSYIHELATKMLHEQTQARLFQTEKMASLGRMVAGVAHEIKNPVNFLYGNFEFLTNHTQNLLQMMELYKNNYQQISTSINDAEEELDIDFIMRDLPQMINSMKSGAERLVTIVGSLQNFSRMDEKTPVPTNLHECIEGTLLILNNRLKGITVIKKYSDVPTINAFSGQLSQVFMNLISNAIDALMDKVQRLPNLNNWKPKIEIITKSMKKEDSNISWICVSIIDNGDGMSAEVQSRVFEPFYTTKPVGKGTGLGLAISYQIVTEKHRGRILVNSKLQQGTGFDVFLPVI